jgi:glutamate racemase
VEPLLAAGADHLVLGCTHFPHLAPLIARVAEGRAVVVDPAPAVARQVKRVLAARDALNPAGGSRHEFIRT